jgi:hypothetical protein
VGNVRENAVGANLLPGVRLLRQLTGDVNSFTPRNPRAPVETSTWTLREAAILRTVLYSSLFEYPLTLDELRRTLLQSTQSEAEVLRTYRGSALLQSSIEFQDGVFFPRGKAAWIGQRRRREVRSLAFLRRHERLLRLVAALPFVRLVALSGSLAVLNADRRADLDLFVITRGRRAWLATLLVVLLTKLIGRRRVVCLNFVMTDDRLALDQSDLFTANQIIHLRAVAGRETYREFLRANPFAQHFYPNFDPAAVEPPLTVELRPWALRVKALIERCANAPSLALDTLSRAVYGRYLRWRARSWASPEQVRLSPFSLKLHTRSHRRAVLDRFDAACREEFDRWRSAEPRHVHDKEQVVVP